MASHRWWRVFLRGGNVTLASLELRAAVGGVDVSSLAARSSVVDTSAWFDSNTSTEATASGPVVHTWDFGSAQVIAEVALRTGAAGTGVPVGLAVAGSDNASLWTMYGPPADIPGLGASATWAFSGFSAVVPGHVAGQALHWSGGAPSGVGCAQVVGAPVRHDFEDSGPYRIAGTVSIDGTPVTPASRRVRLYHRATGRLVRQTWSDAGDGTFLFLQLALAEYLVVSDDYTRTYNAARADAVVPVP